MKNPPNSRVNLDRALHRMFPGDLDYVNARTIVANVVVGQCLASSVAKGGSALKLRYGDLATRVTNDLDIATRLGPAEFDLALGESLKRGWGGFSGKIVPQDPAHPDGVPNEYVMRPLSIRLDYLHSPWCSVEMEVGANEVGAADAFDELLSDDVLKIFEGLALPIPRPVPLMTLEHQIAQKLHAVSAPQSERAHDLIDLQIILMNSEPDYARLASICRRTFGYRHQQAWPPAVIVGNGWEEIYQMQKMNLPVCSTAAEAVEWTNDLIARIVAAS